MTNRRIKVRKLAAAIKKGLRTVAVSEHTCGITYSAVKIEVSDKLDKAYGKY